MAAQPKIDRRSRTEKIAFLNDRARHGLDRLAKIMFTTDLLAELSGGKPGEDLLAQARVMRAMRQCEFTADSPERDMAWFEVGDVKVMMKIDYFDPSYEWGSDDPADGSITRRVITLMRPEDY